MNTVVSSGNFTKLMEEGKNTFDESILVSIVPDAGSEMEKQLMKFVENGGNYSYMARLRMQVKSFLIF